MDNGHSVLPPSGASAWSKCPMWVTMNRNYPQGDTPESLEGTAAHWAFAELLEGNIICEGLIAPNGVIITEEMVEGAELMAETVRSRMPENLFGKPKVEQALTISCIHELCWGTPDVWGFSLSPFVLEVIDYKFGHRFVDEFENDQGVAYIAGALDEVARIMNKPIGALDQMLVVNFTVVQPRCFYRGSSVRTWSVKASDLRGHINKLAMASYAALDRYPISVTNSECRDCPGKHSCEALQLAAYSDAEYAVKSSPIELSPEAASLELKMLERSLERLQSRVEGMREVVSLYIKQGKRTPWHRSEQGYSRQQWTLPAEQVIAIGKLMNVDLAKVGVKTPKQAIKAGVDESVIKAYSVTPLGSIKLIPDNPADARRVFGKSI